MYSTSFLVRKINDTNHRDVSNKTAILDLNCHTKWPQFFSYKVHNHGKIHLFQDSAKWWTLVNILINPSSIKRRGIHWQARVTISFSRTLLHAVIMVNTNRAPTQDITL